MDDRAAETVLQSSDLSKGDGWARTAAAAGPHAGAGVSEVNFFGPTSAESRATAGNVALTSYVKDVSVDGTIDVTFAAGNAKGTFHATWCPGGHER
jgi:hypothetical protein